jgi:hypothetical protein
MANILADLAAALADGGMETPPADFQTTAEHAAAAGLSVPQAGKILRCGVLAGKVERRNFRIRNGARVVPIPHYRVIL